MRRAEQATKTWLWAMLIACAAGCHDELPGKPNPANRPKTPAQITDFSFLYRQNCSGCHGADGKLGPAPPLNDPLFLAIVPDDVLVDVITHGRSGTPMPAFARRLEGALTDEQIKIIADGLKKDWASDKILTVNLPPYELSQVESAATEASIERGEKIFSQVCASCHGKQGAGSDHGESPGRINDSALLTLFSDQVLRRIIITGRPDLGMPDFSSDEGRDGDFKPLTSEQIDDLVALLAHWRSGSPKVAAADAQRE